MVLILSTIRFLVAEMSAKTVTAMCFELRCLFIKQKSFNIGFEVQKKKKQKRGGMQILFEIFAQKSLLVGHFA